MVESVKQKIDRSKRDSIMGSHLQFPEKMGAHGILFMFRDYELVRPGNRKLLTAGDMKVRNTASIILPIPNNLQDSNELRLSRTDLGLFGQLQAEAFSTAKNTAGDFSLGKMWDELNKNNPFSGQKVADAAFGSDANAKMNLAKDARYLLRSYLPTDTARAIDVSTGTTINPRTALTFEGTELKTHSFQWTLFPRNERESEAIKTIINTMKRRELPRYQEDEGLSRNFLKYPNTVDTFLLGVDEDHFGKYKTAMVRSLSISPTAQGGLSLLEGGKPSSVTIDMILMEMDIHTAEDYDGGNYV